MCKSQADGGQRCATHTGAVYAAKKADYLAVQDADGALKAAKLSQLLAAATLYATTRKGIVALEQELASIHDNPNGDMLGATVLEGALLEGKRQRAITKEVERQIARARRDEDNRVKEVSKAIRIKNREDKAKQFVDEFIARPEMQGASPWNLYLGIVGEAEDTLDDVLDEEINNWMRTESSGETDSIQEEEEVERFAREQALDTDAYKEAERISKATRHFARELLITPVEPRIVLVPELLDPEDPADSRGRIRETNRALRIRNREDLAKQFVEVHLNLPQILNKSPWEKYKSVVDTADTVYQGIVDYETHEYLNDNPRMNRQNGFDEDMIRETVLEIPEVREAERVFLATRKFARGILISPTDELTPAEQAHIDEQMLDTMSEVEDFEL